MADISPAAVRSLMADFFSSLGEYEVATMEDIQAKVVLVDDLYCTITADELRTFARGNPLMAPPGAAKTQITDCDDYALQLKASATAHYRQRFVAGTAAAVSPAVAIVISGNHALNLFIEQNEQGKNSICFIDASSPDLPTTSDPVQAAQMMKQPPVKLIYM